MFRANEQVEWWVHHDLDGQKRRIVAQENLRRICPELFSNVIWLDEYRSDDDAA